MVEERFTFFAGRMSVFSQWYPDAAFERHGRHFATAENYMMWRKGVLFRAPETMLEALRTASPREAKRLGRQIPHFDERVWRCCARSFVAEGNYAKFRANPIALKALLDTEGTTLAEAAPWDVIWGIGLAADHPDAMSRATWRGLNWLGEVLTDVRETFAAARKDL